MKRKHVETLEECLVLIIVIGLVVFGLFGCANWSLKGVEVSPFTNKRNTQLRADNENNSFVYGAMVSLQFGPEDDAAAQLRMLREDWQRSANAERLVRDREALVGLLDNRETGGASTLSFLDKLLTITSKHGIEAVVVFAAFCVGLWLWWSRRRDHKED